MPHPNSFFQTTLTFGFLRFLHGNKISKYSLLIPTANPSTKAASHSNTNQLPSERDAEHPLGPPPPHRLAQKEIHHRRPLGSRRNLPRSPSHAPLPRSHPHVIQLERGLSQPAATPLSKGRPISPKTSHPKHPLPIRLNIPSRRESSRAHANLEFGGLTPLSADAPNASKGARLLSRFNIQSR